MTAGEHHAERFDDLFQNIEHGSVVRFQDFFTAEMILKYADLLDDRGCYYSLHVHSPVSPNLHRFPWGQTYLQSMTRVHDVFVHTHEDKEALQSQLEQLGKAPRISVYNLGIDKDLILKSQLTVTPDNFRQTIPGFDSLESGQREFIAEVMRCQKEDVPHRFMTTDRLDVIKGQLTVSRAVRQFLEEVSKYESHEDILSNYRFFFLARSIEHALPQALDVPAHYAHAAFDELAEVQRDFPGVIWTCDALKGDRRIALGALMTGSHAITGGLGEGLNLSVMENAFANRDNDTTVIMGDRTGLAFSVKRKGLSDTIYLSAAGSEHAMSKAFLEIVDLQRSSPGTLRDRKRHFINEEVAVRNSSLLFPETD